MSGTDKKGTDRWERRKNLDPRPGRDEGGRGKPNGDGITLRLHGERPDREAQIILRHHLARFLELGVREVELRDQSRWDHVVFDVVLPRERYDRLLVAWWSGDLKLHRGLQPFSLLDIQRGHLCRTAIAGEQSDDELMAAIQAGNEEAFEALFADWRERLTNQAMRFVKDRGMAEEVASTCLYKVWLYRHGYTIGSNFAGWLSTMCKRDAISATRTQKRRRREQPSEQIENQPPAETRDTVAEADDIAQLMRYRSLLEPEEQKIVRLRFDVGYSIRKTADCLGIPPGTLQHRLKRILAKLRRMLEEGRKTGLD